MCVEDAFMVFAWQGYTDPKKSWADIFDDQVQTGLDMFINRAAIRSQNSSSVEDRLVTIRALKRFLESRISTRSYTQSAYL